MKTKDIDNFGNIYTLTEAEIEAFDTLGSLFEAEENIMLHLKEKYSLEVREDLLILFVQMYLLRFAIPYFQICNKRFPTISDELFLRKILYFCLVGRFVDDLVDKDSQMFETYESILLFQVYFPRLWEILDSEEKEKFDTYLFESSKYDSPLLDQPLKINHIEKDVYERIKYFFCEAEKFSLPRQKILTSYMGVLLGGLDVNDLIADGYLKSSSTVISNCAYHKHFNQEGKLLLDSQLLNFYADINFEIENKANELKKYFMDNQLYYSFHILNNARL